MARTDQQDYAKGPTQDNYTPIGTYAPVPSVKQPYDGGEVNDRAGLSNVSVPEKSDRGTTPGDFFHKVGK